MDKMYVNDKSYKVIKLLGHGKGGYSYLVTDGVKEYVLKQIHHEPCSYYQFGNKIESEMRDYRRLKEIGIPMPIMIEVDMEKEREFIAENSYCKSKDIGILYDGWKLKGFPVYTIVRGRVVMEKGIADETSVGYGQLIKPNRGER